MNSLSIIETQRLFTKAVPALLIVLVFVAGCSKPVATKKTPSDSWAPVAPAVQDESTEAFDNKMVTADEMRELLGANDQAQFERKGKLFVSAGLANSGAKTLEPLEGHPLKVLDISKTEISDLSPVSGMPLEKLNLFETPVSDLSPLAGLPIDSLDASHTQVKDLTPLKSMSKLTALYLEGALVEDLSPLKDLDIKALWINDCPVEDLTPLAGKQFQEINLCDTNISNLDVVTTMKLPGTLWLRNTKVVDLTPLSSHALVSLDIQGTKVVDLSPLGKMPTLERLNIAGAPVTDLTPLKGLSLSRLIFSPSTITAGIDVVRAMPSLQELDTSFEGNARAMSASEFWEKYDRGEFKGGTN